MQNGDLLRDLHVTDLTTMGSGVARADGRVVFIQDALPGSVVHATITGIRKGTIQAVQEEIVTASPLGVQPWCPHFQDCGACLWQHFSLDGARDWKTRHVSETLARIGGVKDITVEQTIASPLDKGFRNKMSFAFGGSEELELGLRRRNGKGVVPVTDCGLQTEPSMRIVQMVRDIARNLGLDAWQSIEGEPRSSGYLRFLVVRIPAYEPAGKKQIVVECITGPGHDAAPPYTDDADLSNREAVKRIGMQLIQELGLAGFVHSERISPADLAQGERRVWSEGTTTISERFGSLEINVAHDVFLQTNTGVASLLYERVSKEAGLDGSQSVWDLYSGAGVIALYIAAMAREIHCFEVAPQAIKAARKNCNALGVGHCILHQGEINPKHLSSLPSPDVIIIDPPRSGIAESVIEVLNNTSSQKILYISCDVATQARDIKRLSAAWKATASIPFDMFPYTPHVENIVVLDRIA